MLHVQISNSQAGTAEEHLHPPPTQTTAVAVCIVFLRHHHLLYSHQSLSLQPDNTVTHTHNTTGDARLQSVLNRLSYSLQPSTVPLPIRISARAPLQVCVSRAEVRSAFRPYQFSFGTLKTAWHSGHTCRLSTQEPGAMSLRPAWAIYGDERVLQT